MITRKNYVKYKTFDSQQEIESWLNDENKIFSNRDNYLDAINRLLDYKRSNLRNYGKNPKKKIYRNIWGHQIILMLPHEYHEESTAKKFVEEYMKQLDSCYNSKRYLYCYKLFNQGKGIYADIICFTRKIYDTVRKKTVVYTSDYYWNPITKRKAKKNDPDAVLLHKKGEAKLDRLGNPIVSNIYVAPVEKKIFKYSNFNINKMTGWLRSIVNNVYLTLTRTVEKFIEINKKYISCPKRTENANKLDIARRYLKSSVIRNINNELNDRYEAMIMGHLTDGESYIDTNGKYHSGHDENIRSFNKLIYKIDKLVNKTDIEWVDNSGTRISIYLGTKQKFTDLKKELSKLKTYIFYLIDEWWKMNICNYWVDSNRELHFV